MTSKKNRPVGIRTAWIVGWFGLAGVIITGLFPWFAPHDKAVMTNIISKDSSKIVIDNRKIDVKGDYVEGNKINENRNNLTENRYLTTTNTPITSGKKQKITTQPINATNSNVVVGPVTGNVNQTLIVSKTKSMVLKQEQIEWLTNFLKLNPKGFVHVSWDMNGEAVVLGPQLALILGEAGWKFKLASSSLQNFGITIITGYKVLEIDSLHPSDAALATGLINVGLDVTILYDLTLPEEATILNVRPKY